MSCRHLRTHGRRFLLRVPPCSTARRATSQVLWKNLTKIVLFNLFGMLGAYEQITQMRNNYWHAKARRPV